MILDLIQKPFFALRTGVTQDDTVIDLTALTVAGLSGNANAVKVPKEANMLEIIFWGGNTNNDTFDFALFAARGIYAPVRKVCSVDNCIIGQMDVVKNPVTGMADPAFYCDTIPVLTQQWGGTVERIDAAGGDRCASIQLPTGGYPWWLLEMTGCDGDQTAGETDVISAAYAYFS